MQEESKFCSACGQQNYISAASCHSCHKLFMDAQNIKFKESDSEWDPSMNVPDFRQKPLRVVVIDFDMKFGSMITFMIKWAIAAIPAMFILFFLFMGFFMLLAGAGIGLR